MKLFKHRAIILFEFTNPGVVNSRNVRELLTQSDLCNTVRIGTEFHLNLMHRKTWSYQSRNACEALTYLSTCWHVVCWFVETLKHACTFLHNIVHWFLKVIRYTYHTAPSLRAINMLKHPATAIIMTTFCHAQEPLHEILLLATDLHPIPAVLPASDILRRTWLGEIHLCRHLSQNQALSPQALSID